MTDTTQPGVNDDEVENENQEQVERVLSPRELQMKEMAERQAEERRKEAGIEAAATTEASEQQPTAEESQLAQQLDADDRVLAGDLSVYKVKTKVDGVERDVPLDELLRNAQKNEAADFRLKEATRLLNEARAATQPTPEPAKPNEELGEVKKKFFGAIFNGDEDTAMATFDEAVNAIATQRVNEELTRSGRDATQITPELIQAVSAQVSQQVVVESALAQSRKDYPELYADPDVEALGAAKINRLVSEGKPFSDALTEVGSEFATKFGWAKAGRSSDEPSPTTRRNEKLERKAGIDNIPATNARAANTSKQEEPVMEASERTAAILAKVAASRPGHRQLA